MKSFEAEVKSYLDSKNIAYVDNGASYNQADFIIHGRLMSACVEVKEKRQSYDVTVWPIHIP